MKATKGNLPAQLSSFVGRVQELVEVQRLLRRTRLLTLTGPGGVGKTRLALRVAETELPQIADGVWFVELAALTQPTQVPRAIAHTVGVLDRTGEASLDGVAAWLESRQVLLILDNCEHLVDGIAPVVTRLLSACPALRILATSRQSLGVAGEVVWRVPSLPLPHPDETSVERLLQNDTAALFIERATAVVPRFALSSGNVREIARICHRVDGLPLAVELAAARVRSLSPEQIEARLEGHFRLLTSHLRTTPARQHTVRATLDWSFDLLSEQERRLFRRLAVFVGGWTLDAAELVAADSALPQVEVLDALDQLVDKSLVQAEDRTGTVRYRFLESIRGYAYEQLAQSGEQEAVLARHCAWALKYAQDAGSGWEREHRPVWLDALERELDNVRAALDWSRQSGRIEAGLRLIDAAWYFWNVRGHLREWRDALVDLLARADSDHVSPSVRATGLVAAGYLALAQGDLAEARRFDEQSLALARADGDPSAVARALRRLGLDALVADESAESVRLLEESVALSRESEDRAAYRLGLYVLGHAHRAASDTERAEQVLAEALREMQIAGDEWHAAQILIGLSHVALAARDHRRASAYLQRGLDGFAALGDRRIAAGALDALALLACSQGQPRRAANLLGAAEGARRTVGAAPDPFLAGDLHRTRALVEAALDRDDYQAAFDAGLSATLEDVTSMTRESLTVSDRESPLTAREREVAVLVARGLTNRQIADLLVISEQTAETHVKHILAKLQLTSRAQVSAWQMSRIPTAAR